MKLTIGILGPGAIGGFLAGLLGRQGHDVRCIGRAESVAAIQRDGVRFESSVFGDFVTSPQADIALTVPVDVLFVTTKSPGLQDALARIPTRLVESAVVVSLLNGVGHREVMRARLGQRLAVGTIGMIEVAKDADGCIRQLSRQHPQIDIASDKDISAVALEKVAVALREAGVSASVLESEAEVTWKKLVRLGAIASLTAAFQQSVGVIRSDPEYRDLLEMTVREGAQVACHEGVPTLPENILKQIDALPEGLTTSLQRDVHANVPSELECITGGILRLAKFYGLPAPGYERAYDLIKMQGR